jgi:hypothetical protein
VRTWDSIPRVTNTPCVEQNVEKAPDVRLEDNQCNAFELKNFRGKPVVLLLTQITTVDEAEKATRALGFWIAGGQVEVFNVADVKATAIFRGLVLQRASHTHSQAVEMARKMFEEQGMEAPPDLTERMRILLDWKGVVADQFGFEASASLLSAVVIDAAGYIRGRATHADGNEVARLSDLTLRQILKID